MNPGPTATRRARKARERITLYGSVCRQVDARDGIYCRVCRAVLIDGAHHHHIVPRSLGGRHTTENLALVCPKCHAAIHAKRISVTGDANGVLEITGRDTWPTT